MKIDRLIGIIVILLQQEKTTAPELAERFEVSRRTISRDIEDICKAGIPLITAQGYGGGISIAEGYKIDKSLFTVEELQAVFAGLKGMDSVSKTSYFAGFMEKLSEKRNRIIADDVIIIDLASHYQASLTLKIDALRDAIREHRLISFRYYYNKGEANRIIEPYRLVFKWSSWYVFGYCLEKKAFRMFKLNRLWDLQTEKECYSPRIIPDGELEFERYFGSADIHLKAEFPASEKYRLIEEYGVDCFTTLACGKLLFERDFSSYNHMRQWIFSFGDRVNVMEPEQLKLDRLNQAENIINMLEKHDI